MTILNLVLNILITVPFYDAVANLFPFGVSYLIKMFTIYGISVEGAYAHICQRQMCLTTLKCSAAALKSAHAALEGAKFTYN